MATINTPNNSDLLFEFTQGVDLDKKLYVEEIQVHKAWASALHKIGKISADDLQKTIEGLEEAQALISSGEFQWSIYDEDIHMNLERFLTEKLGELGKKLHSGRSRNDLIATTLKLKVSNDLKQTEKRVGKLIDSLCELAKKNMDTLFPGVTHLQNGQPVRISHAILSHAQAFKRDIASLKFSSEQTLETLPLGSAAMGGTHLELDFAQLAQNLGFSGVGKNSYDEVANRDFICDALFSFSKVALHLSRISEDLTIWSSAGYQLVQLHPNWSTGSSIMPNKRNPDIAELTRAKSSHVMAALNNALMLLKGLPTAYNSDLHELKRSYLFATEQLHLCLEIFPQFVASLTINRPRCEGLLAEGHVLATEVANQLTDSGLTFREAYHKVKELVEVASQKGLQVHQISDEDLSQMVDAKTCEFVKNLDFETAVESRKAPGGTSRSLIEKQIKTLEQSAGQ